MKSGFSRPSRVSVKSLDPVQKDQVIYPTPNGSNYVTQNRIQVLKRDSTVPKGTRKHRNVQGRNQTTRKVVAKNFNRIDDSL